MTTYIDGTVGVTTPGLTNTGNATVSGTLQVGGITTNMYPIVSGTAVNAATGSPTYIDFTGIPSWVKRITVMFQGVSTSGTSIPLIQIGAGSITATGYSGGSQNYTTTPSSVSTAANTGWPIQSTAATNTIMGSLFITNISGNTWVISGIVYPNNISMSATNGYISLSSTLDRVRITTTNGTDTFDAGTINILYE